MLSFYGEALAEAAADVFAQTGVRFKFADVALASERIGGHIDAADADAFIYLLHTTLGVQSRPGADGEIMLPTPSLDST